jgi:hypothetical protein
MLRRLGLRREDMVADVIASYEEELKIERSRLASLKARLIEAHLVVGDLERQGEKKGASSARLVEHELNHRVRFTEQLIVRMESLLEHFRHERTAGP